MEDRVFFVTIEAAPRVTGNTGVTLSTELMRVKEFVTSNMTLLLQHWAGDNDSLDVYEGIKPVQRCNN